MRILKDFRTIFIALAVAVLLIAGSARATQRFLGPDGQGNILCWGNAQSFSSSPSDIPGGCQGTVVYDCSGSGTLDVNLCNASSNSGWCYTGPVDSSECSDPNNNVTQTGGSTYATITVQQANATGTWSTNAQSVYFTYGGYNQPYSVFTTTSNLVTITAGTPPAGFLANPSITPSSTQSVTYGNSYNFVINWQPAGNTPLPPAVNLYTNNSAPDSGTTATLSWVATNSDYCTSDFFGGQKTPNNADGSITGSQSVSQPSGSSTATYHIYCTGPGGGPISDTQDIVWSGASAAKITLTANPSFNVNPGDDVTLTWVGTNVTACNLSSFVTYPGYTYPAVPTSGSMTVNPYSDTNYIIVCTAGPGGGSNPSASASVTVNQSYVSLTPTTQTITSGSNTSLSWSGSNISSCAATTPSGWTAQTGVSGTQSGLAPTSNTNYTITCQSSIGAAPVTSTAAINVTTPGLSVVVTAPPLATTSTPFTVSWSSSGATSLASAFPAIGDANVSGAVDILDAQQIGRYVAGLSTVPQFSVTNADADQNGQITSADTNMVASFASGGTYVLPTPIAPAGCTYGSAIGLSTVNGSRSVTCTTTGSKTFSMKVKNAGGQFATSSATTILTGMSGTISPSNSSCAIPAGQDTCSINYTWTVTNPETVNGTAITTSPNITVASGKDVQASPGAPISIKHDIPSGGTAKTFFLYNNGKNLDSAIGIANCVSGTIWNGSMCVSIGGCSSNCMSGSLTSQSSCTIPNGSNSCAINFTWNTTNPEVTPSTIVEDNYGTVSSGNSGNNVPLTVQFGTQNFKLFNNNKQLALDQVLAYCATGSWDEATGKCVAGGSLSSVCTVAPSSAKVNQEVRWTADVTGGSGNYTFTWHGDGIPGPGTPGPDDNQYTLSYDSPGTKSMTADIRDLSNGHTTSCTDGAGVTAKIKVFLKLPTFIEPD